MPPRGEYLSLILSARINKKEERGIGIEKGYFFNAYPTLRGGVNTRKAAIVPGTTIGSRGEIHPPPILSTARTGSTEVGISLSSFLTCSYAPLLLFYNSVVNVFVENVNRSKCGINKNVNNLNNETMLISSM